MALVDEEDVRNTFNEHFSVAIPDEIIGECVQLCNSFAKTPEDLVFKWQSICYNTGSMQLGSVAQQLDGKGLILLRKELQKSVQQLIQPKKTGAISARKPQARAPATGSLPQSRSRQAPLIKSESSGIQIHDSIKERQFRYMHERLAERSTVLDDRLDEFAELVRLHYNLEDIGDPASTSDEELVVVGRICCEEDSSKLNEQSVMLETSRLMGAGERILLKFNTLVATNGESTVFPLYPGAIVALKGVNETGEWFQVSEILSIPLLPGNLASNAQERPISMAIAAGPFTIDSNLDYVEFKSFLDQIKSGPFVDINHPSIKMGDVDFSPLELFRQRVMEPLRAFLEEHPATTALIIPSVRDLISHHAVFPQAPLPFTQSDRIMYLPNPCTFSIDHVKFAACSTDVLFSLQRSVLRKRVAPTGKSTTLDGMSVISACILEQRTFYPLFPSNEENLDVSHSELLRIEGTNPDVLILPSSLKHFHKNVYGTAVVNPGRSNKSEHAILRILDPLSARGVPAADRVEIQFPAASSLNRAWENK
ncbi:DNA-directed DNA polymerase alpha subunit pol12 [Serendipita sp. 399]|nr:DNA-directed DNA polymerase alpha subunit pol12 [Serendipita sp. 399]